MRHRRNVSLWPVCAFALTLALAVVLVNPAYGQGADGELEKQAQAIDQMIMCPVCPAETIDQAQVEISFQMRAVVREMLAEGKSREEVLDYFVDRYGADILAAPPKSGANLVAWILPIVGVAAGLVGVFLVIRSMAGRQRPVPVPATGGRPSAAPAVEAGSDPELAPYLEIADRLIASRRASSAGSILSASSSAQGTDDESYPAPPNRLDHPKADDSANG